MFVKELVLLVEILVQGGEWCHSSASASNPTCNVAMASIMQDKDWEAYGYIVDALGVVSIDTKQGTDSTLTISNVAPSITASTVGLYDTDESGDMTLTASQAETTGFKVKFTVTDKNSCLNSSAGDEITSAAINVRRSGIAAGSCLASGDYDANDCYPDASAWNPSCTQTGTCGGSGDDTIEWTCTFPLQYHADPTVADSTYAAENWLADAKATDDDTADTGWNTATIGTEMGQFMSYDLNTASIAYGSLDPGADAAEQSTVLEATGNVGLDETLYGTDMTSGGDTILVGQQKYNLTASQGWGGSGSTTLLATPGAEAELNLAKTTTTGTPATKSTYWVLRVPDPQATGTYSGTNTIEGKVSEYAGW